MTHNNNNHFPICTQFEEMLQTLSSNTVSFETKQCILKRAVSQCPSVLIEFLGLKVPSLLDSGSMVMLVCKGYFTKYILFVAEFG